MEGNARGALGAVESGTAEVGERFETFGRVGWVAKGAIHVLLGILALRVAVDAGGGPPSTGTSEEANQAGAIEAVAERTGGEIVVALLAAGFVVYAAWRILSAALPGDWTGTALFARAGRVVSALAYLSLFVTAVEIVRHDRGDAGQRGDRRVEQLVNAVLDAPLGRAAVAIAGGVVAVIGAVFVHRGWGRRFRRDLRPVPGTEGTVVDHLGTVGWTARGIAVVVIGVFLVRAAVTHDPSQAAGIDDALRNVASTPVGAVLTGVVGAGFVAYGVFAVLSARHRRLHGPTRR